MTPAGTPDDDSGVPPRPGHRLVAVVLVGALAPLALDGCVSVGLRRSALESRDGRTGEVAVAVFRKTGDRDGARPVAFPVLSELLRVEAGARTTVARSMASSWSAPGLPQGRYVLRVSRKIDERGDVVPLKRPFSREFDLKAGERVDAAVVLEKVPVGWIVLAAVTVVLLVVLAIELADEGKLPDPPPLPDPDLFVRVALSIPWGAFSGADAPALEPGVADVFPAPGSVVAARRVAVSFLMTRPLDAGGIGGGAVLAVGTLSGEIPGAVTWDASDQLLRFSPSQDFRPGEEVTVTLDLARVESSEGRKGSGRATTTFRVP